MEGSGFTIILLEPSFRSSGNKVTSVRFGVAAPGHWAPGNQVLGLRNAQLHFALITKVAARENAESGIKFSSDLSFS